MEQAVESTYTSMCSTCLSGDRNLSSINGSEEFFQVFRLLMYDFDGGRYAENLELEQLVCWECLAMMKRFLRFKNQVHTAQQHLRAMAMEPRDTLLLDHPYIPQCLSTLEMSSKQDFDKIYYDYSSEWPPFITIHAEGISDEGQIKDEVFDVAQAVRANINLDIDEHMLEVPEIVLENPVTGVMSHIVVGTDAMITQSAYTTVNVKGSSSISEEKITDLLLSPREVKIENDMKVGYFIECMSEAEMVASREEAKSRIQFVSAVYKCELCVIGFYTQHEVEEHFVSAHKAEPGLMPCKVCYVYVPESKLQRHVEDHYIRYVCKLCGHKEHSPKLIGLHVQTHRSRATPKTVVKIGDSITVQGRKKKKGSGGGAPKPGDLRKLLSKTTIEGYQCLECDMFFKNSRARKNHVARFHREGLQCDVCKKRFVNKTTLATHLRLHEGPLPREECPICHKLVRVIQLKYHIQRHKNKSRQECRDCGKVFSHLATYQAHLKYSRAHASDNVFKFPCPMCNKGYPTKEQMQDHFNYQHLGRTAHKCPVCDKPIASRANVEKHMMRVHGEKKAKPRNHRCELCGKTFTDRKALTQHEVIHSGDRPLSCDICQQTFKQKASLYTHRKRLHKVFPVKRTVEFMDSKPQDAS